MQSSRVNNELPRISARLENSLVFQVDDELISEVDAPAANPNSSSQSSSIALATRASKRKQEAEPTDQLAADIMHLTTGFKEATTILANAYRASQLQPFEPSVVPAAATEEVGSNGGKCKKHS